MKKYLRYLSILPALFMLFFIFCFSAQDGSSSGSLSLRVCSWVLSCFDRIFSISRSPEEFLSHAESLQFFVRKAAHITEYFLLTLSIYLPFRVWFFREKTASSFRSRLCAFWAPTFCLSLICAVLDEFHQSFVPGRCGTPVDVLIDSIGIVLGCTILIFCHFRSKHKTGKH